VAKQPMLKFVSVERDMPEKRAAGARKQDFGEIYQEYAKAKAEEQASRCSQCGVPYCQNHCPLHNNIPDWLNLTATGRLKEAYEVSQATNTFPEICGRICPQDRLCEGNCVIEQSGHGTVTIGAVEKYITDTAWENGWVTPVAPAQERAESVGIIGAGLVVLLLLSGFGRRASKSLSMTAMTAPAACSRMASPGSSLKKTLLCAVLTSLSRAA